MRHFKTKKEKRATPTAPLIEFAFIHQRIGESSIMEEDCHPAIMLPYDPQLAQQKPRVKIRRGNKTTSILKSSVKSITTREFDPTITINYGKDKFFNFALAHDGYRPRRLKMVLDGFLNYHNMSVTLYNGSSSRVKVKPEY